MLGCPYGRKWDSRTFLEEAVHRGARVDDPVRVTEVVIEGGRATGVVARRNALHRFAPADLVVLAAGGFGTPAILERSGIECEPTLFVDPVLTVAAASRRVAVQRDRDAVRRAARRLHPLSLLRLVKLLLHPTWRRRPQDLVGIMIKLADDNVGSVSAADRSHKTLTTRTARDWTKRWGSPPRSWGRSASTRTRCSSARCNAGHPGGMLPLTEAVRAHDARRPAARERLRRRRHPLPEVARQPADPHDHRDGETRRDLRRAGDDARRSAISAGMTSGPIGLRRSRPLPGRTAP